jgi:dipeptidyl aminopeptidase/acylaminoacyl peptidase
MKKSHIVGAVIAASLALALPAQANRLLTFDDLDQIHDVDDPQISPDGNWVAYTVQSVNTKADKYETHLWMVSFDGTKTVQLTSRPKETESHPRWSPDGRYLAFLSDRGADDKNDQIWLLDRLGGEAQKITDLKGGVNSFEWSPDGKRMVIDASDEDKNPVPDGDDKDKVQKPIVIDRYAFMEDVEGYQTTLRDHLYLFDVASRKADILTPGDYYEELPIWSPDGKSIAFVSKRHKDFDRDENWDIYVIAAQKGAQPRQVTTYIGTDNAPAYFDTASDMSWSPDGKWIAYWQGGDPKLIEYASNKLAIVPAAGGAPKILTPTLDRNIAEPTWSDDSKSLTFMVEDDRAQYLGRVSVDGGPVQHVFGARQEVSAFTARHGKYALLINSLQQPAEVFAWDGASQPRQISHQNEWLKGINLAPVQEIAFKSKDGTDVHGFLLKPPGATGGHLPTILRIHGGPQSQFPDEFSFEWQILAAHGYAVVAANPRGSTGRGTKYCAGIYAAWGTVDVQDVLAAVDYAVKTGVADPGRLGVGGWSYGGMATDYTIASDTRFKAATSGASIADIIGGYGNDQYTHDYETELGVPWKNLATWEKVSYPFLHADRIKTPTLFLGGDLDMNVPLHNGEQLYQAERSMGLDTELIVYPGQYHELRVPSYLKDRETRYIAWYDKHLKVH